MQKKTTVRSLAFILILVTACHNKSMTQSADTTPKTNEVKIDPATDMSATGAAYRLDSLSLNGDVLSVFVNYSGGCKEHTFELISNGMYAKSMPPQISLCLKHTNNEDMCKKLVVQELKFNISKIKYERSKSLVVRLGDKGLNYNY